MADPTILTMFNAVASLILSVRLRGACVCISRHSGMSGSPGSGNSIRSKKCRLCGGENHARDETDANDRVYSTGCDTLVEILGLLSVSRIPVSLTGAFRLKDLISENVFALAANESKHPPCIASDLRHEP